MGAEGPKLETLLIPVAGLSTRCLSRGESKKTRHGLLEWVLIIPFRVYVGPLMRNAGVSHYKRATLVSDRNLMLTNTLLIGVGELVPEVFT